jgi:hypothetical protein
MDSQPDSTGELTDLARRLAQWQPSEAGLASDQMLFAAGRASGWAGWPIATAGLGVLAVMFAIGLVRERASRLDLVARLEEVSLPNGPSPASAPVSSDSPPEGLPSPGSYLAARKALTEGLDAWPGAALPDRPGIAPVPVRVFTARSNADVLEP